MKICDEGDIRNCGRGRYGVTTKLVAEGEGGWQRERGESGRDSELGIVTSQGEGHGRWRRGEGGEESKLVV